MGSRLFWFIAGVGAGFVAAHQIARTEGGRAFFDEVNDFVSNVSTSFRERTAEVREAIDDLQDELRDQARA
ncbi:YtxH domain-containing protein [Pseudoclavibacter caeni]|jgi:hypothetical protein|uniref:YtxH domain-containing protein n=1 Tax=Pseudoclavibacter caeni TaxID=908846 RepID=A0A7C8FYB3_9MICO|nr:YtxH domain-containing protein [Pseudoclavibacter caeni]KAB1632951.1 hypothetical protein F8O02_03595 [Pseudoclavibacter caeni]NYJ97078.1 hypothetical protein [Pseudoclavibacter caeni]